MRHLIVIILSVFAFSLSAQVVRIDSTTTTEVRKLYNQAGYQIGKDSISVKKVNGTVDGGDTTIIELTETSLGLTKFRFITIDSLTPYVKTADFAELSEDKIGDKLTVTGYLDKAYNDGTGATNISPDTTGTVGLATQYDLSLISGGSGLTDEQVRDTVAAFLKVSQEFKKTDADAADSLFIELKLRDVSRIAYTTLSHKTVAFGINNTTGQSGYGQIYGAVGSGIAATKATTNIHHYMNRLEYSVNSPATTNIGGLYGTKACHGFGNAAGMGGFYWVSTSGPTIGLSNTNNRFFTGMRTAVTAPTDVDPSTLTNIFGIGWDDDDTNLQFMHNDGSGTATKVDLGSGFPVSTADRTDVYRLFMYAEPNTTTVYYKVLDVTDGSTATGTVSTNLPANTVFFAPTLYHSVGGSSATCGVSIFQLEIFTDW